MGSKMLVHEISKIDPETGLETVVVKHYDLKIPSQDKFFSTFMDFLAPYFELRSAVDKNVIVKFCEIVDFESNRVFLPTGRRKKICEELKITSQQLSNSIHRLKKLGLLSGREGVYTLNPLVYWKGSTTSRANLLAKGSTFVARIDISTGETVEDEESGVKLTFFEPQK